MITQSFDLNLIPDSAPVVVHCDQYDHGTGRLVISLYEGDVAYSPSGTAIIQGIKPDNKGFNYSCTLSGNTVTADLTEQMSAVSGRVRCQIVVTESTGRTGTFVFILDVQSSALPADSDISESDYQLIEQAIEETQQAASDAEAWAVGERGGVPVSSGDPTYNNNSEYWAQIAQQYAQGGVHYKGSVIFANIPTTGMVSGDMYNIQNDFTTDSRFAEGAGINCPAGTNIVWNGSKWDLFAITKMGTLSDLSDVSINTPTDGQGLVYDASIQDWVNGDVSVPDMTTAVKGIGKPDGITTDVTSGTFRAKGVGIVADVNSGGTEYGSDWLYYTGTTTVIVPSTEQMYRVVVSGNASLYYWNGTSYTPLTSSSSSGVTSFNGRTGAVVPTNGDYALNNMSDVSILTPSAGQVLGYDGSEWKNTAAPGGGGSIINVTTTESALHGKTVTLTDGTTTLSSTFDNNGKAQFTGVTLTGNLTLSSSDGTNTATNTFIVNFFGVYTKTLSFFTAYLTMTFPASVGATCTVGGETATTSPYTFTVNTSSPVYVVTLDGQTKAGGESLSDGQTKSVTVEYGTINLTFSNEFRGQTITCTNGGTTITKTAPSGSNSMAFYPPSTGTWVISGTYSGTPYSTSATVSSLSTPVSASLQTVPNGKTVTPTDDIQLWLACGQISGKSYTTLAEVLSDTETYTRLLSDSNACDYMARSTTWTGNSNGTVPTMTSNTTPSGEVIYSELASGSNPAWKAFDGDDTTQIGCNGWQNQWIGYKSTTPYNLKKVKVKFANSSNCKIQAEVNNEWVDIDTLTSTTFGQVVEKEISTNVVSDSYRLLCTTLNEGANYGFYSIQFYDKAITTDANAMQLLGKYDYACEALLSNATWASAIANSDYFESVLDVKVPTMTSNTTPSGEADQSSYYSGENYKAWNAFCDNARGWIPAQSEDSGNPWIQYKFTSPVVVTKVTTYNGESVASTFTAKIEGSNDDGSTFSLLSSDLTISSDGITRTFEFANNTAYTLYRVTLLTKTGTTWNTGPGMKFQFYGRHEAHVGKVIHTAYGNESVYRMVSGSPQVVCTATDGVGTFNLPAGTYTLYSTTAKDPDNLTDDYSKTVTITDNTTDIYLMPDNALYWYGYESSDLEDITNVNGWSRSGYTTTSPTHNTNSVRIAVNGTQYCGVGTKNTISIGSRLNFVAQKVSSTDNYAGMSYYFNSKTLNNIVSGTETLITSTSIMKYSCEASATDKYAGVLSYALSATFDLYAIWYE